MKKEAYIWKEKYSIIKAKEPIGEYFAIIKDKNELTIITNNSKLNKANIIKIEKGWRLITFDMVLPFNLIGFLAEISNAFAEEKIGIFAISAYSTDHILVKEKDIIKAKNKLKKLGFKIK